MNHLNTECDTLKEIVSDVLKQTKALGADAAEAAISSGSGLSATVRLDAIDTIEFQKDKTLGITVYKGNSKGSVSTTDMHPEAVRAALAAAMNIAACIEADPCAGLADPERMANHIPDLGLYFPSSISAEEAKQFAQVCEASARAFDERIVNSEGATFSAHSHYRVYGNTHGFIGAYPSTRYSLTCIMIAKAADIMQRDYDFTLARDIRDLETCSAVGQKAALRALRRLNARKMKTCEAPVIFSADIAGELWGSFISAISGGNLYRKSSFLLDQLGKRIFPEFVQIKEEPHLQKGLGSAPFDQEGVATTERDIIRDGVLQSYVLSSYSARRLGLQTTGNAGGVHNVSVSVSDYDLPLLLQGMQKGLLVTELMGHGINLVTGDYSQGAAGFWVENGEIQYPVEEITIAGNLKHMFSNLVAVGNDVDRRANILTGSLWIDRMTIAGA